MKIDFNMRRLALARLLAVAVLACSFPVWAGEADVVGAKVTKVGNSKYNFDVTIRSNDRGWDYFCDRFEVLTPDGKVLGIRTLLHPHETEQPFTRELYGVSVPAGLKEVRIRAHHKPKGYDGKTITVRLP